MAIQKSPTSTKSPKKPEKTWKKPCFSGSIGSILVEPWHRHRIGQSRPG